MKKIMTYGAFEVISGADIDLFKEGKALGNDLMVVLLDDSLGKFKRPTHQRKEILEAIRYVDEVYIQVKEEDLKMYIETTNVDLILVSKQWKHVFQELDITCDIIYR